MVEDRDIDSLVNELRSLKIRVSQVETELRERRTQEVLVATALPTTPTPPQANLTRGDRVRIINKIKRPANWLARWDERDIENERRATVTHRVRDQVWIVTDNGTTSWRAPNNLERIV